MAKFTITIEVEGGAQSATVKDSSGNEKVVTGLALFGQAPNGGELYTFCWGSPLDAAKAVGESMAMTTMRGDPFYTTFYKALLMEMCLRTGTIPNKKEVTAAQLEERWKHNPANPDVVIGEPAPAEKEEVPEGKKKWN